MFHLVKDFMYNLTDMDFLSMIDNADFYSKKVTIKKFYWQKLFSTLARFIEFKNKHEKDVLARALKEVTYWRLGMVSSSSFKKFFIKKFHSNRDTILLRLKNLSQSLAASVSPQKEKVKKQKKQKKEKKVQHFVEQYSDPDPNNPVHLYINEPSTKKFLEDIEKYYNGEIIFNTDVAERSAYFPPSVEGSLGLIEFDEIDDEKFVHEIAHLIYDQNHFDQYNLSSDEEHHDKLFWKIVSILQNDIDFDNVAETLDTIKFLRPYNVEDDIIYQEEDLAPTPPEPESSQGFGGLGSNLFEDSSPGLIFGPEGPKIYEMGYENYREPFGFREYNSSLPENNRGRSRSPGFRSKRK